MPNADNNRPEIIQIIQIMKFVSMIFPAIAFFQYLNNSANYYLRYSLAMAFALLIIYFIYFLGEFVKIKTKNAFIKLWINPAISLVLITISIMLTGTYESSYKFLFLLVIISSSIECTMGGSLIISGISAATILAIDLIFAPSGIINPYFESDIVLACVFMIISWTIGVYVNIGNKHIEKLNDMANTDGLTGLYNHRFFYEYLSEQINLRKKDGSNLSLLFIDIDNFKYYNDLYGHQKGDEVLRIISNIIKNNVRMDTFIARYGGEEIAVLLPGVGEDIALKVAERLRLAVQEQRFEGEKSLPKETITISIGVATFPTKAKTEDELIKYADHACYRAKFLRKNRVEAYYSILEELLHDLDESARETITSIKTLNAVINAKDKYTYWHVERVAYYCNLIAEKINLGAAEKRNFIYAAYLHDIGKINISEKILMKTDRLEPEEWEILQNHPQNAMEIIKNVNSLKDAVPIILQHHESYDGTGYPNKLKGDEIHILARILTVVDSYDAMTSLRPYQQKKSHAEAIYELKRCSGTQFDPEAVRIFIDAIEENTLSAADGDIQQAEYVGSSGISALSNLF